MVRVAQPFEREVEQTMEFLIVVTLVPLVSVVTYGKLIALLHIS